MRKLLNTFIAVNILCAPLFAMAQSLPEPVQYVVTPEVPGPNQQVTIEAQGIGAFLGDASITWSRDGKAAQSGAGLRTYTFVTGPVGSVTTIRIDIQSQSNGTFAKSLTFRPSTVNLVWEADTSAPPLYLGKTLYSAGSPLKIVAFPTVVISGARVGEQSLSYQWSRNGEAVPAQSGQGRRTLSLDGDQLQSGEDIGVDVYFGQSLVGRGGVSVPASQPQLVLYERDALRGTLTDSALPQSINLTAKEITIAAQPYYFDRASLVGGAASYAWMLDGNEITGPDSARGLLTLRQTGSGEGQATLMASLQNNNQDQLVQSAQFMLSVLFGAQDSGSSFFGL